MVLLIAPSEVPVRVLDCIDKAAHRRKLRPHSGYTGPVHDGIPVDLPRDPSHSKHAADALVFGHLVGYDVARYHLIVQLPDCKAVSAPLIVFYYWDHLIQQIAA